MSFPGAIHLYTLRKKTSASPVASDAEGRKQYVAPPATDTAGVEGRVCVLTARERMNLGTDAQDTDVAILAPLGTLAVDGDLIVNVTDRYGAPVDPQLAGPWKITAVRHAVIHLRLLAKRHQE